MATHDGGDGVRSPDHTPAEGRRDPPEALAGRLDAVERALTGTDTPVADLADAAETDRRVGALETTVDGLDERVAELEAATQALRGYVGAVRAVNREVERRADAALATAESLETALLDDVDAAPGVSHVDGVEIPDATESMEDPDRDFVADPDESFGTDPDESFGTDPDETAEGTDVAASPVTDGPPEEGSLVDRLRDVV